MNKKVVFVMSRLGGKGWGGAHKVSAMIANYFATKGYSVTIISGEKTEIDYPINDKIDIKYIDVSEKFSSNFIKRKIQRLNSYRKILMNYQGASIISFTSSITLYIYFATLFKRSKFKIIASERTDPRSEPNNFIMRLVRNHVYSKMNNIVFQTQDAKYYFNDNIKNKSIIIPNPIPESLPHRYVGKRKKEIINYCRLDPQKNLQLLIDSFIEFHKMYDDYVLRIFGVGKIEHEIRDYIRKSNASEFINLEGFSRNIHNIIRDASMYVSSSNYEGISNSMLEALAIGLPCICTDCPIGGPRMYINSYENGILVPVNDKNALVSAMVDIASDEELSEKLSVNAEKIRYKLLPESIFERWESLL